MKKQVEDLQDKSQDMIMSMGSENVAAIEELLLPQYIYLTPRKQGSRTVIRFIVGIKN
jgi:hypothetical protein